MLTVEEPTSPLFLMLLVMVMINLIYGWNGLVRAEIPNLRATVLGAQVAGGMAVGSLITTFIAYYLFLSDYEAYGFLAVIAAIGLFLGGLLICERIGIES